ncbi:MAG TPA: hypothetical protein VFD92_24190 [Candidatus Binatia bacterium]|nr:hypothetical protein [Candidatus Binatia bacterium]
MEKAALESLHDKTFTTGDPELDGLLERALVHHLSPDPADSEDAVRELWDGWERLKTLVAADKRAGIAVLLSRAAPEPTIRAQLAEEARILTRIGNQFMIRHTETTQTKLEQPEHFRYLFRRLFAFMWLLLREGTVTEGSSLERVRVGIVEPRNGQHTTHAVPMEGTITNLPSGIDLWIVKEPSSGNFHPDDGPIHVTDGHWQGTAFVGNSAPGADQLHSFLIHVVGATADTSEHFRDYLTGAHATDSWGGLSSLFGGVILGSVTVVRDDSGPPSH